MELSVLQGVFLPFVGTALGAGCVLFLKNDLSDTVQRGLSGFAAGFCLMMVLDVALGA